MLVKVSVPILNPADPITALVVNGGSPISADSSDALVAAQPETFWLQSNPNGGKQLCFFQDTVTYGNATFEGVQINTNETYYRESSDFVGGKPIKACGGCPDPY